MSQKIKCDGCGCACKRCSDSASLHLHVEIENLKQRLLEREHHIVSMETNFLKEAEKFPNGELAALTDELLTWQDKYSRLYEAHKRVQKVNQNLEDKLLKIVDKCETEKNTLTAEVAVLTRRLVDEKFNVARLQEENERYRNDVNLAIQLLQCKPSNFVSQRYDSLPSDMQQKVRSYVSSKRKVQDGNGSVSNKPEMKTIKVPIPTFPPTAMVYSVNKTPSEKEVSSDDKPCKQPVDIVSAAIMAKVLEERERERSQTKHCESCTCPLLNLVQSKSSQTTPIEYNCEKCNSSQQQALPKDSNRKDNRKVTMKMSVRSRIALDTESSRNNESKYKESSEVSFIESQGQVLEKDKFNKKILNESVEKIEADLDRLAASRVKALDTVSSKYTDAVREGILVNIDSVNQENDNGLGKLLSGESDDWNSIGEMTPTESDSLITFENKVSSKPSGPRHCSVRMQAEDV